MCTKKRKLKSIQRRAAKLLGKGKLSEDKTAQKLSVSPNTITNWKKIPEFMALVEKSALTGLAIVEKELDSLLEVSVQSGKIKGRKGFQDRKMCLEMTGTYIPTQKPLLEVDSLIIVRAEKTDGSEQRGKGETVDPIREGEGEDKLRDVPDTP